MPHLSSSTAMPASLSLCSHFHPQPKPVDDFRPFIAAQSRPSTVSLAQRFDTRMETPDGTHAPYYSLSSTFTGHIRGTASYRPDTVANIANSRQGWIRGAFNRGLSYVADEASAVGPAAYTADKAFLASTRQRTASAPVIGDVVRFSVIQPVSLLGPGSFEPTLAHKKHAPAYSFPKDSRSRKRRTESKEVQSVMATARLGSTARPLSDTNSDSNDTSRTANPPQPALSQSQPLPSAVQSIHDLPVASINRWSRAPRDSNRQYMGKKFEAWSVRDSPGPLYDTTLGDIAHPHARRVFTSEGKWRP